MTELEIKEQIDVMRSVAEKAKNSKEFALKFLEDAGILKSQNQQLAVLNGPVEVNKKKN